VTATATILRLHWLLSVILVAATVLFAIGVGAERGKHDQDAGSAPVEDVGEEHDDESTATESHASGEENTFGIDRESPAFVVPAVIVSLALAVLVWFRHDTWLLVTVAVFSLLFAVFDVVEVVHQLNEHRRDLALLATVVALLHLAAAFVAASRAAAPTTTDAGGGSTP
jgi:hypothetical protein